MLEPSPESPGARLTTLTERGTVVLPGAYDALTARLAWRAGASAVYLSGGATANALLAAPDIGLVTLTELAGTAARACHACPLPILADADTGFGEAWNVHRSVLELERAGLAGIHLEDQVSPKRCGHLEGKALISPDQMVEKLRFALAARRDPEFWIIARTDARGVEGMEGAIARAHAYKSAGATAIFPEGLQSEEEFAQFREAVPGPLLANMTEFGKTPLITATRFEELGYALVIFPVSALRVMLKAVGEFYADLLREGTQAGWMDRMRTRAELYDVVDYDAFLAAEGYQGVQLP